MNNHIHIILTGNLIRTNKPYRFICHNNPLASRKDQWNGSDIVLIEGHRFGAE